MRARLTAAVALAALLACGAAQAQPAPAAPATPQPVVNVTNVGASINITPKRVTFDKTRRNATVFILNQGETPITVDVALIDRLMRPDGQIIPLEQAQAQADTADAAKLVLSAKDLVQISPRRVLLAPGKGQNIRLRLSALPEGSAEHRSHLTVTTIPPRDSGTTAEQAANGPGQKELRFQINAVYGISIPVIVRPDAPQVSAQITNLRLEHVADATGKSTPVLALDVARTGVNSLYGNFEVRPEGGKRDADPIGLAKGIGVYPEIDRRVVRIPLSREPKTGEKLEVTFTDDDTSPGKVLAKATL